MKRLGAFLFFVVILFLNSKSVKSQESTLNDVIRCKVYDENGHLLASCWFCDCNK
jgi:hypothetical protein